MTNADDEEVNLGAEMVRDRRWGPLEVVAELFSLDAGNDWGRETLG